MNVVLPQWSAYGLRAFDDYGAEHLEIVTRHHNLVASYLDRHPEARERYWNFDAHPWPEQPDHDYHLLYYDILKLAETEYPKHAETCMCWEGYWCTCGAEES